MATITINIPDSITPRVINGLCQRFSYQSTLEDGTANTESKAQFAKRQIIEFIRKSVREAEVTTATNIAAASATQSADIDIQLS